MEEIKALLWRLDVGDGDLDDFARDSSCGADVGLVGSALVTRSTRPSSMTGKLVSKFFGYFLHTGAIQLVGVSTGGAMSFHLWRISLERQCA